MTHHIPLRYYEMPGSIHGIYPILNLTPETRVEPLLEWAMGLFDVGVRIVQVRAKQIAPEALAGFLDLIVGELRGTGLTVILNDYVELVGITGADGVHVGLSDFPVSDTRKILGSSAIIGATCRNSEQALTAIQQGASYVAAGCIYESTTKVDLPLIGCGGLSSIVREVVESGEGHVWAGKIPVCAIGGITLGNLQEIYRAGSKMVAVVDAIQGAQQPLKAAAELVKEWEKLGQT